MAEPTEYFIMHSVCTTGKWLTRSPTANKEGVVNITESIEKNYMVEYMEANWCYCGTPTRSSSNMIS